MGLYPNPEMKQMEITPIGLIRSCFDEKFGIPRQPGIAPDARGEIEIYAPFDKDEAFRGIEAFSHLWILFIFHANQGHAWRPTVRPPRLGGNRRVGVFASRSGFRPNPLGMSVVRLERVARRKKKLVVDVSGIDLMDRTPVVDIKPYLPWSDSIPHAEGGYAPEEPDTGLQVTFLPEALDAAADIEENHPGFTSLVRQVLQADPRPAYRTEKDTGRVFGVRLHSHNVRWSVREDRIQVLSIDGG